MPTLHWIGKEKVMNHHAEVPFKVLEHSYGFSNGKQTTEETGSGNKIIHGDNLEALKALQPEYEGLINCIYIDPPYNTGNEGWMYNDNVNDPKIRRWLKQVVGKEGEDLSRHDKWLCMMYPRLKLLHKLLDDAGSIFISIDDNEQANLKLICDEIFGGGNFIAQIIWQKMDSPKNSALFLSEDHEYILLYAKDKKTWRPKKLPRTEEMNARYKNPDNDPRGVWLLSDLAARNFYAQGLYPITTKKGRVIDGPPAGSYWRVSKEKFEELDKDDRIWWGKNGDNRPGIKRFLTDVQEGVVPQTLWMWKDVGSTRHSKQELSKAMEAKPNEQLFITPKPQSLITRILQLATDKNSIVLDSFAGSGTTAHAVLKSNAKDSGQRKFICIEMEDYSETLTSRRIKNVINGYSDKEGTGGSFDFYKLGAPLFDEDGNLNEAVGIKKIRNYIFYTETKKPLQEKAHKDNEAYLSKYNDTAYYFHYKPDETTTLDHQFLATMKTKASQYVVYADNCLLTKEYLIKHNIIFKKIPRDITRF